MAEFGLLGEKLGHSFSPFLHKAFGGYGYDLIEKSPEELERFLLSDEYRGFNVTIPYKKAVIPYCHCLSQTAAAIGSVNTVVRRNGKLYGENTDYFGFVSLMRKSGIDAVGKKALVLGNGGVSPTVCTALKNHGASEVIVISRSGENNYVNLSKHFDAEIIVNATPVGMYPKNGESLVTLSDFPKLCGVLDVVYNPLRTKLIIEAEKLGIPCAGGLYMLVAQAAKAVEVFTGKEISAADMDRVYGELFSSVRNIVLIGMPGCGKTSCGYELCKLIDAEFIDTDEEIEKRIRCSIPEFFAKFGEEKFREIETDVLRDVTKLSGKIIATGGGVVTRPENYELLHQNGEIVFIQRDINELPRCGRPLSQANPLEKLAAERLPLYEAWCDAFVSGASPADTAEKLLEVLK